jgi:D-inositol-3-phosphate glycosyltransferase
MKILFVLEYYFPHIGGVETLYKNLCEGLVKKGHKVKVCTMQIEGTKGHEILNGVDITRVPFPNRYLFTFLSFYDVLNMAKDVDVIATTTYNGAPPAWVASRLLNKPCVITIHEVLGEKWGTMGMGKITTEFHKMAEKFIVYLGFDKYVGVSQSTVNQIRKLGKDAAVIYNGVDYEHFDPSKYTSIKEHGGFTYLYFGRPGISKGIEDLILACDMISSLVPSAKLMLILSKDPPQERQKIVDMVKKWKLENNVIIKDSVPYAELPKYILGADCVVIPSLSEGFGLSCAEACAMGVPVVANNVDSLPEVISGKFRLSTMDYYNRYTPLAKNIIGVFNGKYTETPLKKFEWSTCVNKYEELFRSLT